MDPETGSPKGSSVLGDGKASEAAAFLLVHIVASRWRLVTSVTAIAMVTAFAFVLLVRGYVAETRFLPELGDAASGRIAGLAAQMGIGPDLQGAGVSLDFYATLARSPDLLASLSRRDFSSRPTAGNSEPRPLWEILGVRAGTDHEQTRDAVKRLRRQISVRRDLQAGLVIVRVKMQTPELAEAVASALLESVNAFNVERRRSRAGEERRFVEQRLEEARRELEDAEGELERFLNENRRYSDSPQLTFEFARLQRRLDVRQQVFLNLSQGYEQARIDEVRDVPLLTVVDHPEGSAEPSPGFGAPLLSAALLGLLVGATLALLATYWKRQGERYDWALMVHRNRKGRMEPENAGKEQA